MALRRNIVIFHLGALGDFIVTWPLAVALARLHPQSRVFYVTPGQKGALAERVLRVESLDAESGGWHRLFSDSPDLPAPAARTLAGAHTVLSFLSGPDDRWARNVAAANPDANLLTINTTAPDDFAGHQAEFLADQLHPWQASESAAKQILHSIADRGLGNAAGPQGPIIIHPGGGAPQKCWSSDRYIQLAENLRSSGHSVRVLLGEVELERWPADVIARFRAAAAVHAPTTLLDLHKEISTASAFIGNDSGPGHLAGILESPPSASSAKHRKSNAGSRLARKCVIQKPLNEIAPADVMRGLVGISRSSS